LSLIVELEAGVALCAFEWVSDGGRLAVGELSHCEDNKQQYCYNNLDLHFKYYRYGNTVTAYYRRWFI